MHEIAKKVQVRRQLRRLLGYIMGHTIAITFVSVRLSSTPRLQPVRRGHRDSGRVPIRVFGRSVAVWLRMTVRVAVFGLAAAKHPERLLHDEERREADEDPQATRRTSSLTTYDDADAHMQRRTRSRCCASLPPSRNARPRPGARP